MKRPNIFIIAVVALLSAISMQSCDTSISENITLSQSKLENSLAVKTELVVDNMIEAYQNVQNISYQNEFDNALTDVLAETGNEFQPSDLVNDTLRLKLKVLHVYKQAIHEWATLADEGFTGRQSAFTKCCQSIQDTYAEVGDSTALKTAYSISTYLSASRYDENEVVKILLNALQDVWTDDTNKWGSEMNANFLDYQTKLAAIPESSFSEEKLQKYVYQPYDGKRNLVEAYKLNLIKERRDTLRSFLTKQDNITSALQCVNAALTEFLKNSCDKNTVVNYLNRIDILLGADNHDDNVNN